MRATKLLGAVAALVLVAGCASGADQAPDPAVPGGTAGTGGTGGTGGATGGTSAPPAETSEVPDFPQGTGRQTGRAPARSMLVLSDVRVARNDGFDRVVLDLRGSGAPGWVVEYLDEAVLEGSGEVVDVGDGAMVQVVASGTTAPAPGYYDGPRRIGVPGGESVGEVYVAGTFEGYTQLFVGLEGDRRPFRTFALEDPTRLVVDVRHADAG